MSSLNARFEKILRRYLALVDPKESIPPDVSLPDLGLDSLSTIELILDLEDEFGVTFPDDLLNASLFRNAMALQQAIERFTSTPDVISEQ